jgi:hypothetical protein
MPYPCRRQPTATTAFTTSLSSDGGDDDDNDKHFGEEIRRNVAWRNDIRGRTLGLAVLSARSGGKHVQILRRNLNDADDLPRPRRLSNPKATRTVNPRDCALLWRQYWD